MPASTPARETKTLRFDVKATGETTENGQEFGHIEAYVAIFNNVDEGNDRILPGAFTRTIQNSKSRAKAREKKYVLPMLWNHDPNELIGGWTDLVEDNVGLKCKGDVSLATQRGREYYALAKAGMSDDFSIIYDIPSGGSHYDKSGVRELSEIRLYSNDPVVFPMNPETYMVGVKSMDGLEYKTVCGSTSGPIGPRDESWDGSAAKKWIWGKALGEDGKVKASVAKKYFMRVDGDPEEKGSYSYPFWTNDHISVGGVKAVANALAGARNADAGEDTAGMKKKVERLYGRINGKYPDAEKLVPPWEDDGKSWDEHEHKDLAMHYNEAMAEDLLEDWQDVYLCSLTCAMCGALKSGDPSDVSQVLDDFKTLVMTKFLPQAEDVDLAQYLMDSEYSANSAEYTMQYGSDSKPNYGYMSRSHHSLQGKAGRAISTSNAQRIQDHIDNLKSMAKAHMKDIHGIANDLATLLPDSMDDESNDDEQEDTMQDGKSIAQALQELRLLRK